MRPSRTNASRLNKSWLRFRIPGDPQPCPSTRRINTGSANQNYCAALSLTCFFQGFNKYHTNRLPTPHAGASPVGVLMDRRHVENPDFQSQKKARGLGMRVAPRQRKPRRDGVRARLRWRTAGLASSAPDTSKRFHSAWNNGSGLATGETFGFARAW